MRCGHGRRNRRTDHGVQIVRFENELAIAIISQ